MSAATIIKQAAADGVTLTVSSTGHLNLRGNQTVVNRWVPVVNDNKPAIVAELQADDPAVTAIRRWLAVIGETHVPTIHEVLGMCANDPAALAYYLKRSTEVLTVDCTGKRCDDWISRRLK